VALTIAGSDSGGGAGIQADLRTFTLLGVFGTSVVTSVTAQNLREVSDIVAVPPAGVKAQIEAVLSGFPVRAAKTGMLYSPGIIEVVTEAARAPGFPPLVVDPVMVASSGARLLLGEAETAYRKLLPRAALITPNLVEAAVLAGRKIEDEGTLVEVARDLGREFSTSVLLKGGHLPGDPVDVLFHEGETAIFRVRRVTGVNSHGSGCILSAAIAALLARGRTLPDAVRGGREYLLSAFRDPVRIGGERLLGFPEGEHR
jgi:hydroxymethylpyrimidine/phosphomethylpyrimidine kinase